MCFIVHYLEATKIGKHKNILIGCCFVYEFQTKMLKLLKIISFDLNEMAKNTRIVLAALA